MATTKTSMELGTSILPWLLPNPDQTGRVLACSGLRPPNTFFSRKQTMANIKSNIKRIGTNRKAEARKKAVRSELKTAIRVAREAVVSGDKTAATAAVVSAGRKIDKAVSKGVLHKNQAANRKSSIAKSAAAL